MQIKASSMSPSEGRGRGPLNTMRWSLTPWGRQLIVPCATYTDTQGQMAVGTLFINKYYSISPTAWADQLFLAAILCLCGFYLWLHDAQLMQVYDAVISLAQQIWYSPNRSEREFTFKRCSANNPLCCIFIYMIWSYNQMNF